MPEFDEFEPYQEGGYQPYPVGEFVREQQARGEVKRHKAEATECREDLKLERKRTGILELALARCIGPTGVRALKDTHPEAWPDEQARQESIGA